MNCRHCGNSLSHTFVDLGFAPPSNAYLAKEDLQSPETFFPLKVMVCENCWLVQTLDYTQAHDLFSADYAYLSSTSSFWLAHAENYFHMIQKRLALNTTSHVVELAANDGYLLKHFLAAGIPCLGVEPTASTAQIAEDLGIPVLREFFGEALALQLSGQYKSADLIIGNNVYAHVPDINDFTAGMKLMLKTGGTITLEFPHLLNLITKFQFDTIYHEHFSYLSLYTVNRIFAAHGLRVFDVEELPAHGGSLRVYGCHQEDERATTDAVSNLLQQEADTGLQEPGIYNGFQAVVDRIKNDLLEFLIAQKKTGKKVLAYGAAAKGNTLLNYAGVRQDLLPLVFDAASSKQGRYLPGSHIPIESPDGIAEQSIDYILILPWNIADEIKSSVSRFCGPDTRFVIAVPGMQQV